MEHSREITERQDKASSVKLHIRFTKNAPHPKVNVGDLGDTFGCFSWVQGLHPALLVLMQSGCFFFCVAIVASVIGEISILKDVADGVHLNKKHL